RRAHLGGEVLEAGRPGRSLALQCGDRVRVDVEDDAGVGVAHQAPRDVRSHPAQADDAELHGCNLLRGRKPRDPMGPDDEIATPLACPRMATAETADPRPADALVDFGITGDLARRMTFPALYRLE